MDQPALSPSSLLNIAKPALDAATTAASPTSERKFKPKSKMSSLETVPESDPRTQSQHAPSPMDAAKSMSSDKERLSTKRSEYFHDVLHERSGENSAAAAVRGEALIYAEIKTNVKASTPSPTAFILMIVTTAF